MAKPNQPRKEQIKMIILISSFILFLIVGYFRFFHQDSGQDTALQVEAPGQLLPTSAGLPNMAPDKQQGNKIPLEPDHFQDTIHDIFEPVAFPQDDEVLPDGRIAGNAAHSFILNGSIVGRNKSMAIINHKLYRQGDWIDGFQVALITEKKVILDSGAGGEKIILEILKHE